MVLSKNLRKLQPEAIKHEAVEIHERKSLTPDDSYIEERNRRAKHYFGG